MGAPWRNQKKAHQDQGRFISGPLAFHGFRAGQELLATSDHQVLPATPATHGSGRPCVAKSDGRTVGLLDPSKCHGVHALQNRDDLGPSVVRDQLI